MATKYRIDDWGTGDALSARFPSSPGASEDMPVSFHWDAIRKLPAGIGPSYSGWDDPEYELPLDAPPMTLSQRASEFRVTGPQKGWGYCTA